MKHLIVLTGVVFLSCLSWTADASDTVECRIEVSQASTPVSPLPARAEPRIKTSGRVPHVQVGVTPVPQVNEEIYRLVFSLPGVEERPTIVSLPGATGMWLQDEIEVAQPKAIVAGREFSHIHPDGSFHAPLPYKRALELHQKGWGEFHPWSKSQDGWDGFVMIYSARSFDELKVVFQLVAESYNYVTGKNIQVDC